MPGGTLMISVPDLEVLCRIFLQTAADLESQWFVQRMIMGGQIEPFDFHKTGFSFGILCGIRRVKSFGLFHDTSELVYGGVPISLNVQCMKPLARK